MRESFKLGATLIIWMALTIILTSATSSVNGGGTIILILAGMFSTIAIWAGGSGMGQAQKNDVAKAKRSSRDRLAKAVQEMDDDEIAQLSDLLSQNDDTARYNERLSR